jgi:GNAT superfamily N-acetyltransferase
MHVIFPAGPQDAQALAEVHVATWRETYRGLLPDSFLDRMSVPVNTRRFSKSLVTPAEHEITLAAATARELSATPPEAHRGPAFPARPRSPPSMLLRAHQGHDLGRALLTAAARAFADQGARSLMISVLRDNIPARGFYEHLGGQADTPRKEPGPGGLMYEVSYRWSDIRTLAR